MKKLFILFVMMFAFTNIINAQSFERQGNTFVSKSSKGSRAKSEPTKTKFTWKDSKGNVMNIPFICLVLVLVL